MDNALERAVERCLACQASVEEYQSPITANKDTGQAMELPVCRTLGAHTGGCHILVVMDGLTCYPGAIVVKGM